MLKVNVSPLFPSHSVYIPFINQKLPQFIHSPAILADALALYSRLDSGQYLLGYNSAGGFSSINHLHFQILSMAELRKGSTAPFYQEYAVTVARNSEPFLSETLGPVSVKVYKLNQSEDILFS